MPTIFYAQYTGHCAHRCGEPIRINEPVCYTGDDELVHADCLDSPPKTEDPTKACPDCWLIHPDGVKECE